MEMTCGTHIWILDPWICLDAWFGDFPQMGMIMMIEDIFSLDFDLMENLEP